MYRTATLAMTLALAASGPSGVATVEYAESSIGLGEPQLDGGTIEIEMGDVDGDGNLDLVSVGDHGNPFVNTNQHGVIVWRGDGTGRWSVVQSGNFGYGGVALGDVDGDGLLDVGYGIHHDWGSGDLGDQLIEVALGDGTGAAWSPWDDGLATNGETWGMAGTDFADVDGDGDLDLGSNSFGCCAGLHVYLNQGDGTWLQSWGLLGGNSSSELTFGDVDGDGWPDFAASHDSGTVWLGDGFGDFRSADGDLPGGGAFDRAGVALGDIDGDGRDELAWADGGGGLQVWSWTPGDVWIDRSGSLPDAGGWEATQLADMNGDGTVDLAAFGNGRFTLWLGDGAGGWTETTTFTTPSPGRYEAFRVGGDADHNGFPDIALVALEGGTFNARNRLRFFRETSAPHGLGARLVAPRPGARLRSGRLTFVDWVTAMPPGHAARVNLAYSTSGPEGPWTLVAERLPDSGRHQWVPPQVAEPTPLLLGMVAHLGHRRTVAIGGELLLLPGH